MNEEEISWCDNCGYIFVTDLDAHDIGEVNICCDHCAWRLSNNGEPQPKHTCQNKLQLYLKKYLRKSHTHFPKTECYICAIWFDIINKRVYKVRNQYFCYVCGPKLVTLKNLPSPKERVIFT